jgi:integral membrane protein (TIGR01906 family)
MKNVSWFSKISSWLVSILTPFVILMISIRILISPLFAQIEYQLPGFPEDPYGFTLEDRLRWSEPSIKYLVNSEGIGYLESLRFENGEPIYNPSELSHMEDVKSVVTGMRIALAALTVILLIFTMININKGNKHLILQSFHNGGWGILGLIGAIMILLVISFNQLFTWFHQIFFESGTWRFYTSDTLIRLFPMRFWRDAFIFVGVLCILFGVITILVTRKYINLEKSK